MHGNQTKNYTMYCNVLYIICYDMINHPCRFVRDSDGFQDYGERFIGGHNLNGFAVSGNALSRMVNINVNVTNIESFLFVSKFFKAFR